MGRPFLILAVALLVTAASLFAAGELRIETNVFDLLPRGYPASDDFRFFLETFGLVDRVFVVVSTPAGDGTDVDALAEAACLLAKELIVMQPIAAARCGATDEDEEFLLGWLLPRAPLLLNEEQIPDLARRLAPGALQTRVADMKRRLASPLGGFEARLFRADPLGITEFLQDRLTGGNALEVDPLSGAFLSRSRQHALVIIEPRTQEGAGDLGQALAAAIEDGFAKTRRQIPGELQFDAVGGPLYAVQDEAILRGAAVRAVAGSSAGILLLLVLYFHGVRIPVALLASVVAGVAWTAALTRFVTGEITVIGLAFGSVLVGLGVDYGIHGGAAYRRSLDSGADPSDALREALARTGPAILASAATTAVVFLILAIWSFGPMRELGQLVSTGIVLILVSTATLGAALAVIGSPARGNRRDGILSLAVSRVVSRLAHFSARHAGAVVVIVVIVTALAIRELPGIDLDAGLDLFRPIDHPALRGETLLAEEFSIGMDTTDIVVSAASLPEALDRAAAVRAAVDPGDQPGLRMISAADFLVEGERLAARRRVLEQTIDPAAVAGLRDALLAQGFRLEPFRPALQLLDDLAHGRAPGSIPPDVWPDWLAQLIREEQRTVHASVHIESPAGAWPEGLPAEAARRLQESVPEVTVASALRVASELHTVLDDEFRRLIFWCLLAVGLTVLLSFRMNPTRSLLSLLPVALGSVWLLATCAVTDIPLNLFSVAAAPLLLGIGIDDGLHALHGMKSSTSLVDSISHAGPAMTITTLTTSIGFGGLMFTDIPALRLGGTVIALGTILCLVATLTVLPALDSLLLRRRGN